MTETSDNSFEYKGKSYKTFSTIYQCYYTFIVELLSNAEYNDLSDVDWFKLLEEQGLDMDSISIIHKNLFKIA